MRQFSIVVIVIVVVAAVMADQAAWNAFKQMYGKKYKNAAEEQARMKMFMENKQEMERHNKLFKNKTVSYEKGLNKFSDMSNDEFYSKYAHSHYGSDPHDDESDDGDGDDDYYVDISDNAEDKLLNSLHNHIETFEMPDDAEIPSSIDWRKKGAVTSVKDQCGPSCGLYGPIGATEGQYFLKTGKLISLSAQNLMDCLDNAQKTCYGILPDDAYSYMRTNGIDSQRSYPFTNDKESCNFDPDDSVTKIRKMVKIPSGDEKALTYAIATVGPIGIGIDFTGLKDHKSGTYYQPKCTDKYDHVVLAVGYGSDDDGDYYIIKNNWGTDWGEKGFYKMARNRDSNCGIANHASFPKL